MSHRRWIGAGVALWLLLGLPASTFPQGGTAVTAAIRVFQFQPGALEVRPGARVSWTNEDDIKHTVTSGMPGSSDGRFDLRLDGKGTTGSATFTAPGVYPYFCARHTSMRGEVVVR
jgi:plastocyanin